MPTRSTLAAALFLASFPAFAAQTSAPANPADEQMTLQQFGARNPACLEWNDGCSTCKRDDKGPARCSTPGIACQPAELVCKSPAP